MIDNETDTQDILKHWKNNKFVIVDWFNEDDKVESKIIVLTSLSWSIANIGEISKWCVNNGCRLKGMTVEFDNEDQMLMFCLRWA